MSAPAPSRPPSPAPPGRCPPPPPGGPIFPPAPADPPAIAIHPELPIGVCPGTHDVSSSRPSRSRCRSFGARWFRRKTLIFNGGGWFGAGADVPAPLTLPNRFRPVLEVVPGVPDFAGGLTL